MWCPPSVQALGAREVLGPVSPGMRQHEGKLVSFSEAAAGEATLSLLPAGADLTRGSRCHEHALQAPCPDSSSRHWSLTTLSHSPAAPPP